ncbi:MAG: zinc-dependent metalloprotease [Bacteroidota bacterium]|nr:zinc-dependent metalloprotease [Bacteroidota bacterium]
MSGQLTNTINSQKSTSQEKTSASSVSNFAKTMDRVDEGVITVMQKEEKVYWGIADSLLDRDFLLVSRVAGVPNGYFGFYSAGAKTAERVLQFSKVQERIIIKEVSYENIADSTLPIYESVQANNFAPILAAFDQELYDADTGVTIIELSDFFTEDIEAISGVIPFLRREYQVRRLDSNRSYIESVKSFPKNLEVRHVLTYQANNPPSSSSNATLSIRMSQSMVLLPKVPMQKRLFDYRVGWFTIQQIDFGSEQQKAVRQAYIRRWRLEPSDSTAYFNGELVEPKKPIVYYLDPATPEKYRSYIIKGIEDWNPAFEEAGFKNAIQAKLPPTPSEDPDWSPEDIRYSTVRWVANEIRNAVGPSVSDPRSGEIIESDIVWYHNHMRSYRNRLMIETGAANPEARKLKLADDLIGETMRRVISHEIGHALGLPHNMQSSSAYPVDSLRSGTFTQKYGIATTIMEYARQNYIAQPGDDNIRFIRQIGPYDLYSVNWGYRLVPNARTPEDEKETLDSWIMEKSGDPMYRFAGSTGYDPSAQTEDLGDDPVKASTYGLLNLKRVVPELMEWTYTKGEGYQDLEEIYSELIGMWSRYSRHVATNIGGVYQNRKSADQIGFVYTPVSRKNQLRALEFLNNQVFSTPYWLLDLNILQNIQAAGSIDRIQSLQRRILNSVLDPSVLLRLIEYSELELNVLPPYEMLQTLRLGIWKELYDNETEIDVYRRTLQREYLSRIHEFLSLNQIGGSRSSVDLKNSDIRPLMRTELILLEKDIKKHLDKGLGDGIQKAHLEDAIIRIEQLLQNDK